MSEFDIKKILNMLDWNAPKEVQKQGIEQAKKTGEIKCFIQPTSQKHNKNVWDNCALVLAQKSDAELEPYLPELLEWTQDLNWPGALVITDRLKKFSGGKLKAPFIAAYKTAKSADICWGMA